MLRIVNQRTDPIERGRSSVVVTIGAIATWWLSSSTSWLPQEKVDKAFDGANVTDTYSVEGGDAIEMMDGPKVGNGE